MARKTLRSHAPIRALVSSGSYGACEFVLDQIRLYGGHPPPQDQQLRWRQPVAPPAHVPRDSFASAENRPFDAAVLRSYRFLIPTRARLRTHQWSPRLTSCGRVSMANALLDQLQEPQPALVVKYGNSEKRLLPLDKTATVLGRGRGCDIELNGPEVSAVHCVITRDAAGLYLRDCQSRAGTRVN